MDNRLKLLIKILFCFVGCSILFEVLYFMNRNSNDDRGFVFYAFFISVSMVIITFISFFITHIVITRRKRRNKNLIK